MAAFALNASFQELEKELSPADPIFFECLESISRQALAKLAKKLSGSHPAS